MEIKFKNVSWGIDNKKIIKKVSLNFEEGKLTALLGPNGSGKSSLLKLIYKMHAPKKGSIYLGSKNLLSLSHKDAAKYISVVNQERNFSNDFTVFEIVKMGRYPHKGIFEADNADDNKIVENSLRQVGASKLINRDFYTLSGGEKQRVLIARALAQEAKVVVLDEPTNHLDIKFQFKVMELLKSLGKTTIIALHNLNIALLFVDYIYFIKHGRIIAHGEPGKTISISLLKNLYDLDESVNIKISRAKDYFVITRSGSK